MADFEINDLASAGVVTDIAPYQLPPEAWSTGLNVRYKDDHVETLSGWSQVFGTPLVAPYHIRSVRTTSQTFWLYMGLAKGTVYDGTTHTDITRAVGGDYVATGAKDWNSTVLGGVPIFNNGADIPQAWMLATTGTKLTNLAAWDSTVRAKRIIAFGPFLVYLNLTISGTNYPHRIRWSHPADPGSVPASYDVTDETRDTGEFDYPDVDSGPLIEALTLQSRLAVYKESSIWAFDFIGGQKIMDSKSFLENVGIFAPRCVAVTPDGSQHFVVTQDDIIVHNLNSFSSVLTNRVRRALFAEIDPTNYASSFVFTNPITQEVWFCYPTEGQTVPNKALIWNSISKGISFADGINFQHAAVGPLESSSAETWDSTTGTWDTDTGLWSDVSRRQVLLASPQNTKFYKADSGMDKGGTSYTSTLQRTGLALIGKSRTGKPIVDFKRRKMFLRLWPKMGGEAVNVRVGVQETVKGAVTWRGPQVFTPDSDMYVDIEMSGRALAIEFSSTGKFWTMDGYKAEVDANEGEF